MLIYAISGLINAVISIILGFFVLFKNSKGAMNKSFFFMSLSIGFWSFGYYQWQISADKINALFWVRILSAGSIMIPIFYFYHILTLLGLQYDRNKRKILNFAYGLGFIFLMFNFTPMFVKDVTQRLSFKYWPVPGPIYIYFILMFFGYVSYACYLMFTKLTSVSGLKGSQIKYAILATIFGFGGGATNYLPWYNIPIYPFGNFIVFSYAIILAYSIVRYRHMDITVAITRTGIFVAVYTLVLGLPFAVAVWLKSWLIQAFGAGWWWMSPLGLMAALATVGPFIYIYISRRAEERLLKEQRRYQNTLKQASLGMTRIRNLRRLLDLITHIITKTVRISYAAIYLYDKQADKYVLQVSRDKGRISIPNLNSDNPLVAWIMVKREPLVYEEVKRQLEDTNDATYRHLEENMRLLNASVVIPSLLEDKFLGFIVLGDKLSGQIYTPDDLNVFQVLASQAALAIENAQFYEETQKMQEQIAQAEKMATIGTMADGLSHQINNRFYALSLIAGDTIDTIKVTDTSKCTPEVKEMLDSINHALGRIQTNVMQGGEVVKGILKYTRKGDESFGALTLDQILDGTLEMVQYKVKLSEIDLMRDYPKDIPRIKGNLVQLQEAFFNFIDNAYDAIVERRTTLKEDGYRGKITVSAQQKDSALGIVVEDNGMGIKDDNLNKIFTPFFTTKTSARRGTGLGLYVIRRIITDTHKGKIALESSYGFGTRFILELPIAK